MLDFDVEVLPAQTAFVDTLAVSEKLQVLPELTKLVTFLKQPAVLNQAPSVSPHSLEKWVYKARHLSEFVKQSTAGGGLGEFIIATLLRICETVRYR